MENNEVNTIGNTLRGSKLKDQNTAINLLIGYLDLANRRGTFSLEESAKIWEAIRFFYVPNEKNQDMSQKS
tara:strand:+ start:586 stop:798 length:213 start_codon:yes stop_codon:yes gene_type:complete